MEEEATKEKKRYWLKLDKDFLKNPQMKVIKNLPNGKDYIIFYLSLMLESVETVGHLRFTSLVPYNEEMLSSITDTNIDIVRTAIKIFCDLGIMQIFDDGTIFIPSVPKMTGKECESAERVRQYRLKQQQLALQCNSDVTKCNDNKDKQRTENKEQLINKKEKYFDNNELNYLFKDFLDLRKKLKAQNTDRAIQLLLKQLENYDDDIKTKMIENSISNSWKGLFELKNVGSNNKEEKKDNLVQVEKGLFKLV